jgi:hypothetical protein
MEKFQKPSNFECYTPSPEHFSKDSLSPGPGLKLEPPESKTEFHLHDHVIRFLTAEPQVSSKVTPWKIHDTRSRYEENFSQEFLYFPLPNNYSIFVSYSSTLPFSFVQWPQLRYTLPHAWSFCLEVRLWACTCHITENGRFLTRCIFCVKYRHIDSLSRY